MEKEDSKLNTPGDVFAYWRTLPDMQEFVRQCYYDDVLDAADRFYKSEEFREVHSLVCKYLKKNTGKLLDIGGGNGMASLAWNKSGFEAYLIEPDSHPVVGYGEVIKVSSLPVISAYGENLPVPSQYFDVVYVRQVLHHLPDLSAFMNEVYRVLKPGGILVATREHVISTSADLAAFHQNHPVHQYTKGEHAYLLHDYVTSIKSAGLLLKQVIGPASSVINYAPTSTQEFHENLQNKLSQRTPIPSPIINMLLNIPAIKRGLQWFLSYRDSTPGRLYSFVAMRP
ncbi:MAG: hypothetical protein Kow00117_22110 [Phototrophicales bacterium]